MPPRHPTPRRPGFVLVLSLTVMAMLLLLCLSCGALLTLEMKSGRSEVATAKARLNATAAARIALGELQRLAGPDRRITANAGILDRAGSGSVKRPKLVGVWKGLTSESGNPAAWSLRNMPALAPVSGYDRDHEKAFVGWLASGRTGDNSTREPALTDSGLGDATPVGWSWIQGVPPRPEAEWILLTKGASDSGVFKSEEDGDLLAPPESFSGELKDDAFGRFAWVVMDENQKARIDLREDPKPMSPVMRAAFSAASARRFHPAYAPDGTGGWKSRAAANLPGGVTWTSLPLDPGDGVWNASATPWIPLEREGANQPAKALRHDFTTESVSLLTDVANGGLKRDLSVLPLMAELPASLAGPAGYIGQESESGTVASPTAAGRTAWWRSAPAKLVPEQASSATRAFWPVWSDVREWASFATTATVMDGAGQLRPMVYLAEGVPTLRQIANVTESRYLGDWSKSGVDRTYQSPWRQPILYRYRLELSLHAQPESSGTTYRLLPKANVIIQIWNPYNVDMELDPKAVFNPVTEALPFDLYVTGKDAAGNARSARMRFVNWYFSGGSFTLPGSNQTGFNSSVTFNGKIKAGAIKTYSVPLSSSVGGAAVALQEGYYPGHYKYFGTEVSNRYAATGFHGDSTLSIQIQFNNGTDNYRPPLYVGGTKAFGVPMLAGGNRDGTPQNPLRILGPTQLTAQEPRRLVGENGDTTLVIFENRLKAEAMTGGTYVANAAANTGGDAHRFWAGEPPGIFSRFWLNDGSKATWFASPYESVIWSRYGYADAENKYPLEVDGGAGEVGFGGTGYASTTGVDAYVYHHVPLHPPIGLLSLRHARLGGGLRPVFSGASTENRNAWLCNIHDAFGNSLIAPYVPTDALVGSAMPSNNTGDPVFTPYDMSWLMNSAVADAWFVSSLGAWDNGLAASLFPESAKSAEAHYRDFRTGAARLPDRRFVADPMSEVSTTAKKDFLKANTASADAYRKLAGTLLVEGGFNFNSTSVRAWRAFLASAHADTSSEDATGVVVQDATGLRLEPKSAGATTVTTADIANAKPTSTPASDAPGRVNGGRVLSETELDKLARAMVAEVKKRGPFLSVSEFLNRRIEAGELGHKGAAQAAIDATGLNAHLANTGRALTSPGVEKNADLAKVYTHSGVNQPGWLSQADLLAPLATAMTARGDTFVIRVSASSPDNPAVRATMEVTVRRTYAYINGTESADTEFLALKESANRAFGRRFVVLSYRWLAPEEI